MSRRQFTEEQILAVLKEAEAGAKPAEVCRQHGISDTTWRTKYAGLTRSASCAG